MSDIIFKNPCELRPEQLNCNVFSSYDYDGLSMQELLSQFYTKISECVDLSNKTFKLADWLVNEGLEQNVSSKLEEWLRTGKIEEIISKTVIKRVRFYSSYEKMVNDSPTIADGESVITQGYYAPKDGGGSEYVKEDGQFNLIINDVINVKQFGAKSGGTVDATTQIQSAIDYAVAHDGGTVFIPAGKYLINGTLKIPSKVILKGAGKNFHGGTILWRDEGGGLLNSFIELGNKSGSGAVIECGVSDLVIIGDTLEKTVIGIQNKGVSVHGIIIKNIDFECFAGIPIKLSSQVESSRVQFLEIDNVDIGFDWGTYKEGVSPKTNNNVCGGVWLEGYVDGVYINNCRFTNHTEPDLKTYLNGNTCYGVRIESWNTINPKNNIKIENSFFRGFKSAIFTNAMNISVINNYIEHCKSGVYMEIKDVSSLVDIQENYFSGCEKILYVDDKRSSKALNCYANVFGNYFKWGVFDKSYLFDGVSGLTNILIYNGYNCTPTTWQASKFEIASPNIKDKVYGVTNHTINYKREMLSNPVIGNGVDEKRNYTLKVNTSMDNDYGLDVRNTEGKKLFTFDSKNSQLYVVDGGGDSFSVMKTDQSRKQVEFPNNIILKGTKGRRYAISVNEGGNAIQIQQI